MNARERISLARQLAESGEYMKALKLSDEPLENNPNHVGWLCLAVFCLEKVEKLAVAYHLCKRLIEVAPRDPSAWLNLVNLESRLWMTTQAIKSARKGLQYAQSKDDRLKLLINLGCIYVDTGRFDEAMKYLKEAAEIDPTVDKVWSNMGFCSLAKRNWSEGWAQYRKALGRGWRTRVQYKGEPEWDGTPNKTVVLYGEQGIGDQICFASMVEDAAKDVEVILDVHPKLKNLFARSFPNVGVYGTHGQDHIGNMDFDASLPLGQLGEYYRTEQSQFPVEPFLVPDEERVLMWRALWRHKAKPVIGIAWTGGIQRTGRQFRVSTLEDWLPLFNSIDAHWVSLEYKPSGEVEQFCKDHPEIDLKEYTHSTLTDDYDDTAALVASLDCVVSVPTSAAHLAGALGVPVVWLKHVYPCWKVAAGMPFHPVTEFINWEGTWKGTVKNAVEPVESILATIQDSRSVTTSCGTALNHEHQRLSA